MQSYQPRPVNRLCCENSAQFLFKSSYWSNDYYCFWAYCGDSGEYLYPPEFYYQKSNYNKVDQAYIDVKYFKLSLNTRFDLKKNVFSSFCFYS